MNVLSVTSQMLAIQAGVSLPIRSLECKRHRTKRTGLIPALSLSGVEHCVKKGAKGVLHTRLLDVPANALHPACCGTPLALLAIRRTACAKIVSVSLCVLLSMRSVLPQDV